MTQEPQETNIIENRPLSMENCSKKTGLTKVLEGISSLLIQLVLMPFPDSGSCSLCRPFLTDFLSKTQSGDRSKDITGALYSGFALYWGNQMIFFPLTDSQVHFLLPRFAVLCQDVCFRSSCIIRAALTSSLLIQVFWRV